MSESAKRAEPSASLQSEDLEGGWDDHLLLLVIWGWDSLEGLEPLESVLSSLCLVWGHATDSSPEDLGGSPEVIRSTAGLDVTSLPQEVKVLQLVTVKVS